MLSYTPVRNSWNFKLKHSTIYINSKNNNRNVHKGRTDTMCKICMWKTTLSDERKERITAWKKQYGQWVSILLRCHFFPTWTRIMTQSQLKSQQLVCSILSNWFENLYGEKKDPQGSMGYWRRRKLKDWDTSWYTNSCMYIYADILNSRYIIYNQVIKVYVIKAAWDGWRNRHVDKWHIINRPQKYTQKHT